MVAAVELHLPLLVGLLRQEDMHTGTVVEVAAVAAVFVGVVGKQHSNKQAALALLELLEWQQLAVDETVVAAEGQEL